jgi:tRNA pseudouridine38-40 synthase
MGFRFKLTVEYDGSPYAGWQRQNNAPSVQAALERAASALDGTPVAVYGAGRTDSGVHATGQVAHCDLTQERSEDVVRDALNHHLRAERIAILEAQAVSMDFHARFSAIERRYLYRLLDRRTPSPLLAGQVWHWPRRLDTASMHEAAQCLVGRHDFTTFRDINCQADSPVKSLDEIGVSRIGEEVQISCRARSFLHRQVRSIVGSLVEVGNGRWDVSDMASALEAKDRQACGRVAPAHGLYLTGVGYPPVR